MVDLGHEPAEPLRYASMLPSSVSVILKQPITNLLSDRVTFTGVNEADFDELAELRIAAMRPSLERVGRFNPERARERLRNSFHPEHTEFVNFDGHRSGFYTFRPTSDAFHLDHLYIAPSCQSQGIGSYVIRYLLARSDALHLPVHLGALRDSASNRFYKRHGFIQTAEDDFDIYYARMPLRRDVEE